MHKRHDFDFYKTPEGATNLLLEHIPNLSNKTIFEPCAGEMDIANVVKPFSNKVICSDIRDIFEYKGDATKQEFWDDAPECDWIITNPPFSHAVEILEKSLDNAKTGVAFLLRLTFLEPCKNRAKLLSEKPPCQIIVTPRISFTGDGKKDNVTTAWMVWHNEPVSNPIVIPN